MFSDDSDVDVEDVQLTVNEHYAKAYEYRKEREELAKLKEKYGSDVDEDADEEDSEDAESEDEDGEELTPAMDAAILRTLARIKRKDPAIYETGKDVFEEERKRTGEVQLGSRAPKDKSKPLTIRQHALAAALEDASGSRSPSPEPLTYVQEQERLREDTIAAFKAAVEGADEDVDFLVPREKTKDEIEREEEEYRAFLEREVGQDLAEIITVEDDAGVVGGIGGEDEEGEEEKPKKKKKSKTEKGKSKETKAKAGKSKQDEDQEFLMNYILNRGWIDKAARRLPTYKEITGKGKGKVGSDSEDDEFNDEADGGGGEEGLLVDEDEFDDVADAFESSYNFRFEEPDAAEIARYPRNIASLVRRQDTARKDAREKRKARKEEELLKKREEIKRLKALKMKELRAKLERIGAEGGKDLDESKALQDLDLEADWDPEAHDRQMRELYENDVGGFGGDDGDDELEKPTWADDIDITDIVPHGLDSDEEDVAGPSDKKKKKKKKKKKGGDDNDDGGVDVDEMDADVERAPPAFDDDEEWDGTEEMRKQKLEEYMDEVYGLDFNDMVGGMPTRFHYAKVDSQTFGLSSAEILMATDAELNTFMGIKKYAPYRKEGKGRTWDAQRGARLKDLKDTLKERGAGGAKAVEQAMEKTKKRKGKKERMREKAAAAAAAGDEDGAGEELEAEAVEDGPKEKRRKRKAKEEEEADEAGESDDAADGAEGASRKRKRRRHRKTAAAVSA
ncbi:hypothetical protein GSI_04994 [Ganoderma sinense ZZ0214-1]|uniref:Kri1-like C-terminal domain-containing protein n=1 Tax=Ganoderma sinense ZZ0214-1 TaxID=1077348 RepID=A0A2G8SGI8_9APHY|nr:hypothetical protein GSI_04994 [Ganoderma sinense ZZ0214-1]